MVGVALGTAPPRPKASSRDPGLPRTASLYGATSAVKPPDGEPLGPPGGTGQRLGMWQNKPCVGADLPLACDPRNWVLLSPSRGGGGSY